MNELKNDQHNCIYIFLCTLGNLSDEEISSLSQKLPKNQKYKLLSLTKKKRRNEFIIGRSLLIQAVKHYKIFNLVNSNIIERHGDAPYFEHYEDHHISISHSKDIVCCVIHNNPIGVDIEYKKNRKEWSESAQLFMDQEELKQLLLLVDKKSFFYKVWTIKEAIFKTLNAKEQKETSLQSIPSMHFSHKNHNLSLFESSLEDYQLALTYMGDKCTVKYITEDINKSCKSL